MKQVVWVIVVLLVIWGVYALATKSSAPTETNGGQTAGEGVKAVNLVDAADQKPGKEVVVGSYTLSAPGYIAVHAVAANDTPGDLLGTSALLTAGSGTEVKVPLTVATKDAEKVIVMLHLDTDANGTFDATLDMPATMATETGGQAVVMKMVSVKK